jgi:hypothetical protein
MKVFIHLIYAPCPIFEIELELIKKHRDAGDQADIVRCTGELETCFWNPEHKRTICGLCRSKGQRGIDVLGIPSTEVDRFAEYDDPNSDLPDVFADIEELKAFTLEDGAKLGLCVASSIISKYARDHRLDTHRYRREIHRELRTAHRIYKTTERRFASDRPDRAYLFNGRISSHAPILFLCEKLGIPYFTYEVAGLQNRYLLRKNATPHSIDAFKEEMATLWDQATDDKAALARQWFEAQRNGVDMGIPSYTKKQKRGLLPDGFDRSLKNIAIYNSTIEEYAAVEKWKGEIYSPDETEGVRQILRSFKDDKSCMFYLRVHPHMKGADPKKNTQIREIHEIQKQYDNVRVIFPEEKTDTYSLMDACDIVLTFGSTIGIEACFWNKPSILAGRAVYEHLACVYKPTSHDEVVSLIQSDLRPLDSQDALHFAYREVSYGVPFRSFRQTGVRSGFFSGKKIEPSGFRRLVFLISDLPRKGKRLVEEVVKKIT